MEISFEIFCIQAAVLIFIHSSWRLLPAEPDDDIPDAVHHAKPNQIKHSKTKNTKQEQTKDSQIANYLQNLKMTYQMQSIMQQVTSVDSCSSSFVKPAAFNSRKLAENFL